MTEDEIMKALDYCRLDLQKRIINRRADMDCRPDEIRAEAIKEFAERFKRKILPYICCGRISFIRAEYELDDLVKEMTEVETNQ